MSASLIANIALLYAILIGVNVPAPFLGLHFENTAAERRLAFEPPGWVIPLVWVGLFALLGTARYELTRRGTTDAGWLIVALAVLCATYAYYTLGLAKLTGLSALWFGLGGNLIVILAALLVASAIYARSPLASALVLPVAVWTTFATAIVVGQLRGQGLV